MIRHLLVKPASYSLGKVAYANDFDRIDWFKNSTSFEEFDAYKGDYSYRVVFDNVKKHYVIASKYRI